MQAHPVFITGSPRSGTSVLAGALLTAGYGGFYEGNFLSLIRTVDRIADQHMRSFHSDNPRVLMSAVDTVEMKEKLFAVIADEARRLHPAEPWMDKTGGPEMIEAIPILQRLFPGSRFIFAHRRGIENLVSRMIKFPAHTFEYHCRDWAKTMAAWRRVRQTCPGIATMAVDQHDIARRPRIVAQRIGTFLRLDEAAVEKMAHVFRTQRPQQTRAGSAVATLSLRDAGWSEEQLALFETHCGAQMRAYGYSTDESYRTAA